MWQATCVRACVRGTNDSPPYTPFGRPISFFFPFYPPPPTRPSPHPYTFHTSPTPPVFSVWGNLFLSLSLVFSFSFSFSHADVTGYVTLPPSPPFQHSECCFCLLCISRSLSPPSLSLQSPLLSFPVSPHSSFIHVFSLAQRTPAPSVQASLSTLFLIVHERKERRNNPPAIPHLSRVAHSQWPLSLFSHSLPIAHSTLVCLLPPSLSLFPPFAYCREMVQTRYKSRGISLRQ